MGKGSRWRETDYNRYYNNWDKIKKGKVKRHTEEIKKVNKITYKYK